MKPLLLSLLSLFSYTSILSQNVTIPDIDFKTALIDAGVDSNADGIIQLTEAHDVLSLSLVSQNIHSLEGINSFAFLEVLDVRNNNIVILEIDGLFKLEILIISENNTENLLINACTELQVLDASDNELEILNLTNLPKLNTLDISRNNLQSLDLSNHLQLQSIDITQNPYFSLNVSGCISLDTLKSNSNLLEELDISGCTGLRNLYISSSLIESLEITEPTQLVALQLFSNLQLKKLKITNQSNLLFVSTGNSRIEHADFSNCSSLPTLYIDTSNGGKLKEIHLSGCIALQSLSLKDNSVESLDLTGLQNLNSISVENNNLKSLFIKNEIVDSTLLGYSHFDNNPNLEFVCVDAIDIELWKERLNDPSIIVNSFCPDATYGTPYSMEGKMIFDSNNDGCDDSDFAMPYQKILFSNSRTEGSLFTSKDGFYILPVLSGETTLVLPEDKLEFFNSSPEYITSSFPGMSNHNIQDFCLTANEPFVDVELSLIPITTAVPGFQSYYKLIIQNTGNQVLNEGSISLNFPGALMVFESASSPPDANSADQVRWLFEGLKGFETKTINVTFLLNQPGDTPPLNGGDILNFTFLANGKSPTEMEVDETFTLNQEVVNSFDPNDKTCLQGSELNTEQIGDYLHYLIRFENNGTAIARDISIEDEIDTTVLNISTLQPIASSHPQRTQINQGNIVSFIFDDINLPFDDDNNDGYVAFKIKTKDDLTLGDSINNYASIFFDFNFPIITNTANTVVTEPSNTQKILTDHNIIEVNPNPVIDILNIELSNVDKIDLIEIWNIHGIKVYEKDQIANTVTLNLSSLSSGVYIVKVAYGDNMIARKIIKQ